MRWRISQDSFFALSPHGFKHFLLNEVPDVIGELKKILVSFDAQQSWPRQIHFNDLANPGRPRREDHHPIGKINRFLDLVRDENNGLPRLPPHFEQLRLHDLPRLSIQRGERLIHEQYLRIDDQRAGEVHALLHASGELVGIVMLESRESDESDILLGFFSRLLSYQPLEARGQE